MISPRTIVVVFIRFLLFPLRFAFLHLRRTWTWNLRAMPISAWEQRRLSARGIDDITTRQYLVWRRSTLLVAGIATCYSAVSRAMTGLDVLDQFPNLYSPLGKVLVIVNDFSLFALPGSSLLACFLWTRLKSSRWIVVVGWVTAFLIPVLLSLIPSHDWFNWDAITLQVKQQFVEGIAQALDIPVTVNPDPVHLPQFLFQALDLVFAVLNAITLLPTVLSVIPGMFRACMRLKVWLPESVLPGWSLVTASPLYCFGFLIIIVNAHHVTGNWMLLSSALLFATAPLVYTACAPVLLKPLAREKLRRQYWAVRGAYSAMGWLGLALLLIFLFTREISIGGQVLRLVGFDSLTSLVRPWDFIPYGVEYFGRAFFITVVVADLILRMHCSVWAYAKSFANSRSEMAYDEMMGQLSKVVGAPIVEPVTSKIPLANGNSANCG